MLTMFIIINCWTLSIVEHYRYWCHQSCRWYQSCWCYHMLMNTLNTKRTEPLPYINIMNINRLVTIILFISTLYFGTLVNVHHVTKSWWFVIITTWQRSLQFWASCNKMSDSPTGDQISKCHTSSGKIVELWKYMVNKSCLSIVQRHQLLSVVQQPIYNQWQELIAVIN